jgi:PAS domain S-box-containing protein
VRLFETLWRGILMSNRYRQTVATIDDALFNFTFDEYEERRYLFITTQAEHLTGYAPETLVASGEDALSWIDHLVLLEDQTQVRVHDMALRHGEESRVVYRVLHRSGEVRWLREHATPLRDEAGFITVSGMLTDVTEQKAAEEVLLKAKREAESSNRHKTQFIATMSHEIRTPLGAVNGYSQLLANELEEVAGRLGEPLPPQVGEFIEAIRERSERLLTLVNDLFDLSNIEMGTVALQRVAFPVSTVVERVSEKLLPAMEARGIEACIDVDPGVAVLGDPRRVEQVIHILLANAAKFTDAGRVVLRAHPISYEVVIEVIDSGVGISEAHLERLFTPFAQEEDWRSRQYEGTGLGLTLVKRLLDLMEGRIEVESQKGEGSTFRVFLPAARRTGLAIRQKNPQPRRHSS